MGRYMTELGMTPAARSRVTALRGPADGTADGRVPHRLRGEAAETQAAATPSSTKINAIASRQEPPQ